MMVFFVLETLCNGWNRSYLQQANYNMLYARIQSDFNSFILFLWEIVLRNPSNKMKHRRRMLRY